MCFAGSLTPSLVQEMEWKKESCLKFPFISDWFNPALKATLKCFFPSLVFASDLLLVVIQPSYKYLAHLISQ